ncbi:hypothetical protein R70723_06700 [Paenibacillus sp. FSL R7-0273]|uniref:hypothetical protein n=1 Tax=Paenibacillus sp. FSL R7-0273 TaxID=1536772 RepID=UPI0004F76E22|nr:hypothetical protein [Paenibacillus sp. FSL R7-0273]AIQ45618.1 hypothetical protein R70723_06700 [Paenibacillus sp. FSL R7-0273]OMF95137.1 hypothetical protein BK144_06265 [Paenibacillus sp. FSL R7-0273]
MKEQNQKGATSTESMPAATASEAAYTKRQFLESAKYSYQDKDVLAALLEQEKLYTVAEAQQVIDDFKNKEAE